MSNEKDYHQFSNPAFNKGYWDGYELHDKENPYLEGSSEWSDYEAGYEEGWLDS